MCDGCCDAPPRSYTLIGIAVATAADVSLDVRGGGGCGQVLRYILSLSVWWPIAALAYCAYLSEMAVDVVVYGVWFAPFNYGVWYAEKLYFAALGLNLVTALALALVVERPFLKLRNAFAPGL